MDENDSVNEISQIELAFFNDGYKIAASNLSRESTSEMYFKSMQQFYGVLDAFIDVFVQNANESSYTVKCKKGCAWCCSQAVFAQGYEFKFLKNWMIFYLGS
jgi:hypothetical protein